MKDLIFNSRIASIDYDPLSKILNVVFRGNISRKYGGVPQNVYDAFIKANDLRWFFEHQIDGKYPVL